jgi:large subunit ribosomal protein L7/L12
VRFFSSEEGSEAVKEEKPAAVDDDTVVVDLSTGENVTPPSSKILKLADEIVKLNMLEINDLGKILQEKMGISDQQLYGMGGGGMVTGGGGGGGGNVAAAAGDAGGGDAPAAEAAAQTEFSLKLDAFDASSKIKVIKEVRAATELGLKEAKELVEGAPCVLKKGLSKADAEAMMAKIVAAGATCSLE